MELEADIVKIDRSLIAGIDACKRKQVIVKNLVATLSGLGAYALAEGVETQAEFEFLKDLSILFYQRYYFAKPGFQTFPEVDFSVL